MMIRKTNKIGSVWSVGITTTAAFAAGILLERYRNGSPLLHADDASNIDVIDGRDGILSPPPNPPVDEKIDRRTAIIAQHGFPSLDSIRSYANFVLSYDRRNRIANWVMEYVTPDLLQSQHYDRSGIDFFEDRSFHPFFRATNRDYKSSGYDRGHMAAAGNYRSRPEYIRQTYVLSNISPQTGRGFNRDKWNELEQYCRRKVLDTKAGAWICTGPLYLARKDPDTGKQYIRYEVIGPNQVAVPTHFFKAILYQQNGQYILETFLMPNESINEKTSIQAFRINPEVIERAAGILLFNELPRNRLRINP